ncbi:MAG TPA: methyltransferase domain-containing protein, partial [Vicinamibacteria bacterium]|nr:methyltransferase domain-containing protein [Vicinamibacteria bacterium]
MLYRNDLAHIHDERFGDIARHAAPVLLEALKRTGHGEGLVVDLGCGSGLFAKPLAAAGYDVLGFDVSRSMLALARRRVPKGRFQLGSLHEMALPRAVAVAGIGETFNYYVGRPLSDASLARLFGRIRRALLPGGILLFDMAAP